MVLTFFLRADLSKEERAQMVKTVVLERLPEDNYVVLKYVVQFLAKVSNKYLNYLAWTLKLDVK